jgi:hypothetical protein
MTTTDTRPLVTPIVECVACTGCGTHAPAAPVDLKLCGGLIHRVPTGWGTIRDRAGDWHTFCSVSCITHWINGPHP